MKATFVQLFTLMVLLLSYAAKGSGVPVISGFSPVSATSGNSVEIGGTNFSPVAGDNIVFFGATRASVVSASETNLTVTVPVGATYAPITVAVNGLVAYAGKAFLPTFTGDGSAIGASTFAPRQDLVSGDGPVPSVIADLDGDGKPDLVVANLYAHCVSLFRSVAANGSLTSASFEPRVDFAPIGGVDNPYSLIAADVDGDGKLDIVMTDRSNSRVGIHRNVSSPGTLGVNSFTGPVYFDVGSDPRYVRVADLDGDGRADIVSANTGAGTISILRNIGAAGTLTTNSFAPKFDLSAGAGAYDVGIGDLDGDGKPDIAVVNDGAAVLSVFRNIATAGILDANSFAPKLDLPAPIHSDTIILRDLDGDGKADIIAGSFGNDSIYVYRNVANPGTLSANSFQQRVEFPTGNGTHNLALGDLNGDGKPDVAVVGESQSYLSVFQNLSTAGSFTSGSLGGRVDYGTGWNAWGVSVGDLDGDSRPDVVFCNAYDDTVSIYRNVSPFDGSVITGPVTNPANGHIYYLLGQSSWTEAETNAVKLGGHLVTINDAVENDWVLTTFSSYGGTDHSLWIGFSDSAVEGSFVWTSGDPVTYTKWKSGEPNASAGAGEDYAYIYGVVPGFPEVFGQWNDISDMLSPGGTEPPLYGVVEIPSSGPPVIHTQPASQTVVSGNDALFAVGATGSPELIYQWSFGTTNLVGATNSTLILTNVQLSDAGNYYVVVTNLLGSATSSNATLTVTNQAPFITAQPQDSNVLAGTGITFIVGAGGSKPLSYQWQFNSTSIADATNSSYTIQTVQTSNAGLYSVVVTNLQGSTSSSNAVLTVLTLPTGMFDDFEPGIDLSQWSAFSGTVLATNYGGSVSPLNSLWFGGTGSRFAMTKLLDTTSGGLIEFYLRLARGAVFPWEAADLPAEGVVLEYSVNNGAGWSEMARYNTTPYTNWTFISLAIPVGAKTPATLFRWRQLANSGSVSDHWALDDVGVNAPPKPPHILTQPANQSVDAGGTATFSVIATGSEPLIYQWLHEGTNVPNATNVLLVLANVQSFQAGNYSVLITNFAGMTNSINAVLTVTLPPPMPTNIPVVTGVSPLVGSVGAVVSITGTNFSAVAGDNVVYFGAVRATVVAASETNLTVTVPVGATYAPITVTVNGLVAYAGKAFLPTFTGDGSAIGASTFAPRQDLVSGNGPVPTVIADLDGDGKPDLAVANLYAHTVSLFRSVATNGALTSASFEARVDFPSIGGVDNPYNLIGADVDGDGKLDLVMTDRVGNRVGVYRNVSSPGTMGVNSFIGPVYFDVGSDPRYVRVADLDGDGRADIVSANVGAGTISILRNIGAAGTLTTNSFAPRFDLVAGAGAYEVAISDLDGDGRPDLAVANAFDVNLSLFRNVSTPGGFGVNSFAPKVDLAVPVGCEWIVAGDLDGDNQTDLVLSSAQNHSISVYRNSASSGALSTNSFASRVDFPTDNIAHDVTLGDLNGDGRPEIAVVGESGSYLSVFQNLSTPGSFSSGSLGGRVDFGSGNNAWGVSIGDLDVDGRPDVIFCNAYSDTVSIYRNTTSFGGPPFIITQPASQTVATGDNVVLSVTAGGSGSFAYQWSHGVVEVIGAISQALTLTNIQSSDAGTYFVVVTNSFGAVTSSNALLTVTLPPATVRVASVTNIAGTSATVPIVLSANGNENAVSFSLDFSTQHLAFVSISLGSDAADALLFPNTSQAGNGRIGVIVAKPSDTTFIAGTREVVQITFNTPLLLGTQSVAAAIVFTNTPITTKLSDAGAQSLPATFANGAVTLVTSDLEGDATPRPLGDRSLDIFDLVQVGRFVAALDFPTNASEFQHADCAPRDSSGDGQFKVTDWVQSGRYVAGLDPLTVAGGPDAPVAPVSLIGKLDAGGAREVVVADKKAIQGVTATLPVTLESQGNENGLGFTLVFDSTQFVFAGASKGSSATAATFNVNSNQAAAGRVGLALILPSGSSFAVGSREVFKVNLKPKSSAYGDFSLTFADQPVVRSVSDTNAVELSSMFTANTISVSLPPSLNISVQDTNAVVSWPSWAEGFDLQTCADSMLTAGAWTNVVTTTQTNGETIAVKVPVADQTKYFRLRHR